MTPGLPTFAPDARKCPACGPMQLTLFNPPWWTPADQSVVNAHRAEDARDDMPGGDPEVSEEIEAWCQSLHPRAEEYTCRRCQFWRSEDGERGDCDGPELGCGDTRATSCCEQWVPRERGDDPESRVREVEPDNGLAL